MTKKKHKSSITHTFSTFNQQPYTPNFIVYCNCLLSILTWFFYKLCVSSRILFQRWRNWSWLWATTAGMFCSCECWFGPPQWLCLPVNHTLLPVFVNHICSVQETGKCLGWITCFLHWYLHRLVAIFISVTFLKVVLSLPWFWNGFEFWYLCCVWSLLGHTYDIDGK